MIIIDTSSLADKVMTTNGDMVYYNSGRQRLAKGSDGQQLQLAGGLPSWVSAGGSSVAADEVVLGISTTEADYTLPSAVTASANQAGYVGSTSTGSAVSVGEPNNRFKSEFQAGSTLLGLTVTGVKVYAKLSATSHGTNQLTIQCCKGAGNTGASFGSFNSSQTTPVISTSGQWLEKTGLTWQVEEGDGIGMKIGTTGITGYGYRHSDDRDNEITITGGGASICSPSSPSTSNDDMSAQYYVDYIADGIITATGGYFKSNSIANPYVQVDMGSDKNLSALLFKNTADTTATTVTFDVSSNGSDWTTVRTCLVSKLTDDTNSYVRFNNVVARYIRCRVSDVGSTVLSCKKFYILDETDGTVANTHGHLAISTTDTSLDNDGT